MGDAAFRTDTFDSKTITVIASGGINSITWFPQTIAIAGYSHIHIFPMVDIEVVKKTFRFTNVFLLQPLMPLFLISEHKCEKRYKKMFL